MVPPGGLLFQSSCFVFMSLGIMWVPPMASILPKRVPPMERANGTSTEFRFQVPGARWRCRGRRPGRPNSLGRNCISFHLFHLHTSRKIKDAQRLDAESAESRDVEMQCIALLADRAGVGNLSNSRKAGPFSSCTIARQHVLGDF